MTSVKFDTDWGMVEKGKLASVVVETGPQITVQSFDCGFFEVNFGNAHLQQNG